MTYLDLVFDHVFLTRFASVGTTTGAATTAVTIGATIGAMTGAGTIGATTDATTGGMSGEETTGSRHVSVWDGMGCTMVHMSVIVGIEEMN